MFFVTRKELLKTIHSMRRRACCYDGGEKKEPSFCDCKYGAKSMENPSMLAHLGEQTGCPELRSVEHILSVMKDSEYEKLVRRK